MYLHFPKHFRLRNHHLLCFLQTVYYFHYPLSFVHYCLPHHSNCHHRHLPPIIVLPDFENLFPLYLSVTLQNLDLYYPAQQTFLLKR
eukprot:UN24686